MVNKRERAM